jgi:hypothetical protein
VPPIPIVIAGVFSLSACDADPPAAGDPLAALPTWSFAQELAIGHEEDPNYALTPVSGFAVSPRHRLVFVAQRQDAHLRVFDFDGRFIRAIGRRGDGPGEFRRPFAVGVLGDTIWTADYRQEGWFHFFTLDGEPIRSERMPPLEPPYIGAAGADRPVPGGGALRGSTVVASEHPDVLDYPIFRTAADGALAATLPGWGMAVAPLIIHYEVSLARRSVPQTTIAIPPFSVAAWTDFAPDHRSIVRVDHTAGGAGGVIELRVTRIGIEGDTLAATTLPLPPRPIPTHVRDSLFDRDVRRLAGELRDEGRARRELGALRVPDSYPPVRGVVVGHDLRVWLQLEGENETRWLVLDPELRPLAFADVPPGMQRLLPAGEDLWGIILDENDVPRIFRYRVVPASLQR